MAKFCSQESQLAVLALAVHLAFYHVAYLLHTTHVLRHLSMLPCAYQCADQLANGHAAEVLASQQEHSALLQSVHMRYMVLGLCWFAPLLHNMPMHGAEHHIAAVV